MLIEFNVKNYKSIKDEISLSLIADSDKKSLSDNYVSGILKKDNILKSASIFGANASGKSNILKALHFFKRLIENSATHKKGDGIRYEPFKLDNEFKNGPICMSVIFIKNRIKYIYGISYVRERVISEYLIYYKTVQPTTLFERYFEKPKESKEYQKINDYYYYFPKNQNPAKQKRIAEDTNENTLYLSKTRTENFKETDDIYSWFNDLIFIGLEGVNPLDSSLTVDLSQRNEETKKLILNALNKADLGIDNFDAKSQEITDMNSLPKEIKSLLAQNSNLKLPNKLIQRELTIFHKGEPFNFELEESEGTKKMFSLMGHIIDVLENGKILLFDELDVKLHNELNQFILELFHDSTQNKKNSQLILTTHNTSLLDQEIFRRDQIWFTEKDPKTFATFLFSLLEFKPRKDHNLERGYLAGKYGAIPFIKSRRIF
jgi:AAA15 family ATPase/GTPase